MRDPLAVPLPPEIQRLIDAKRYRDIPAALAELGLAPAVPRREPVDPVKMKIRRIVDAAGTPDNRDGLQT